MRLREPLNRLLPVQQVQKTVNYASETPQLMTPLAKDIAQKEFLTLSRDTSALDAARLMKSKGTQFVIVSTPGSLEGIVTEWDYISKIVAEGKNPAKVKLADIMSSNLITVDANDPIDKVAQLMTNRKIRRVLVLWETEVYGVITANNMLAAQKAGSFRS